MATPRRQTRVSWEQPRARPSVALAGNDPVCFLSCKWSIGQFSPPIIRSPAGIVLGAPRQGRPYAGSQSCFLNQCVCPHLCEEQACGTPWDSPAFLSGPVTTRQRDRRLGGGAEKGLGWSQLLCSETRNKDPLSLFSSPAVCSLVLQ